MVETSPYFDLKLQLSLCCYSFWMYCLSYVRVFVWHLTFLINSNSLFVCLSFSLLFNDFGPMDSLSFISGLAAMWTFWRLQFGPGKSDILKKKKTYYRKRSDGHGGS